MPVAGGLNAPFGAQCFPTGNGPPPSCWWLCLNAPFGAQCFPTIRAHNTPRKEHRSQCTFWCSVLSDKTGITPKLAGFTSQCTFWCSVLSDRMRARVVVPCRPSQCTFWCSVLSDDEGEPQKPHVARVSMHLLVLSAFRHIFPSPEETDKVNGLNAPFGAQCFPTRRRPM